MSTAKITRCRHYFHGVCLRKWLYVQDRCPLCHEIIMHQEPAATEKQTQAPAPNAAAPPTPVPLPAAAPVVAPVAATAAAAPVPADGLTAAGAADESDSSADNNVPHVSVGSAHTLWTALMMCCLCCRTMTRLTAAAAWTRRRRRRRRHRRSRGVGTRTPAADRRTFG